MGAMGGDAVSVVYGGSGPRAGVVLRRAGSCRALVVADSTSMGRRGHSPTREHEDGLSGLRDQVTLQFTPVYYLCTILEWLMFIGEIFLKCTLLEKITVLERLMVIGEIFRSTFCSPSSFNL